MTPRWRKLARDLWMERGRVTLMIVAVTVSLAAVGAVLGAYALLTREIGVNYLGTRPASVTLELEGDADDALVGAVRRDPAVLDAEARDVVLGRVKVGDDWRPILLFVFDDFARMRLNTVRMLSGARAPPDGTALVERTALPVLGTALGQALLVRVPGGAARALTISGVVHDPGLAPAWQERQGYAYISRATLRLLGGNGDLHELRVLLRDDRDIKSIEGAAAALAASLVRDGHAVHQLRVPPPRQHPHQRQMKTILVLMLSFAAMTLLLSAILVATSLAGMLARQVREIGIMKALGARALQIGALYAVLIGLIGVASIVMALPLGVVAARALSTMVAGMLNFELMSVAVPSWVFVVQAIAGLLVPLLVSAVPIARASSMSVRDAMDLHGASGDRLRERLVSLPPAVRNAFRRPVRLALTLALLSAGGAMFMTALNVSKSWAQTVATVQSTRHYDVEVLLDEGASPALLDELRALPGVRAIEAWGDSPAAFARTGEVDVVRTYPDRGHGSLEVAAPPARTSLVSLPLLAGRWLEPGDVDAVVLSHTALAQAKQLRIGDVVPLSLDGLHTQWRLVGIVQEVGSPGTAWITDASFARVTGASANSLRVAVAGEREAERDDVIRALEAKLDGDGVGIEAVMPVSELERAVGGHVEILIQALLAMALVMAIVGALGLASAMGISVLERTRELGIMKALGATPARVTNLVLGEALAIALMSWAIAVAVSLPLTLVLDEVIGSLGFLAPLPFAVSAAPILAWLAGVALGAVVATVIPARRAGQLTVRDALATT